MTLAICIRCGAEKLGAWTPCVRCEFMPADPEDRAKAVLLSDHTISPEELRRVAKSIEAGKIPKFDQEAVDDLSSEIAQMLDVDKPSIGCTIAVWTPIIVMIVLVILVLVRVVYPWLAGP